MYFCLVKKEKNMEIKDKTIGGIVAEDFRTAAVFKKYGIDFCCKGNRSIEEVCAVKKKNPEDIYADLERVTQNATQNIDFKAWDLDLLSDYIEKTHHRYVEEKTIYLLQFLDKLRRVKGDRYPELIEVHELFKQSAEDLGVHMKKEELVLFPFIRNMVEAKRRGVELPKPHFGAVENPIEMMKHEHENEGERFEKIAQLLNQYTPPADACNTHQVTYKMLQEFEENLHTHIHLENNILFPKAIELQKELQN